MPITDNKTVYQQQADGTMIVVSQETIEIPSDAEVIADKEAQLLKMYNELQELKNNSAE